jgi:hypothetical protein
MKTKTTPIMLNKITAEKQERTVITPTKSPLPSMFLFLLIIIYVVKRPTVCVTRVWAGVDTV